MARLLAPPAVSAAMALAAGCGQGFDRDAAIESFSEANPGATAGQAECVVDQLIDRYGIDQLGRELEATSPPPAFTENQFRAMFGCGIEGDVRDQIVQQLEANDVDPADAPCVADRLVADLSDDDIDVLLSGDITDEFLAKFVAAMEDCGAINS